MSIKSKENEHLDKIKYNSFITDFLNHKNFEQKLKIIFNHELNKEFKNILLLTKEKFIDSVKQNIFSILTIKFTNKIFDNKDFVLILSKYIQKLNNKYEQNYIPLSQQFNIIQNEKEKCKRNKNSNISKFYFSTYRKHCSNSSNYAIHFCNIKRGIKDSGKFIKIYNNQNLTQEKIDYVICENCQEVYFSDCFPCYCEYCKEEYFSSQLNNDSSNDIFPATLKKNHCETIINDLLYCPDCKNILYLNLNNNILQCMSKECKNHIIFKRSEWKCKNCSKTFYSEYKIYNPLEIKLLSEEINYSLLIKFKAKPNKLPCCKYSDLKIMDFYHSHKCDGLIYFGEFNSKKFIICEKCKAINYLDKYIWICPKCKCRFREIKETGKSKKINIVIEKKEKDNNEKMKHFQIKPFKYIEKRRRILSQEYDYDNNESYSKILKNHFNDENCDINIINNNYKQNNLFILEDNNYTRSRNNKQTSDKEKPNDLNFSQLINSKLGYNTIENEEKYKKWKKSILSLTSNNFYSEKNDNKLKSKNNRINQFVITTNSNNKNINKNNSLQKRKYYIPFSEYNRKKEGKTKENKIFSLLENKSNNGKLKNYTPIRRKSLIDKKKSIITKNISSFNITIETKENKIKNRSPFLLRRILNLNLGNIEDKKNKKKDINLRKNHFFSKLNKEEKNYKIKRDNSINYPNSIIIQIKKSLISTDRNQNKSENKINFRLQEKNNLLPRNEAKVKKNIECYKNKKSKSGNKIIIEKQNNKTNEKENNNIQNNCKNKFRNKIKREKEDCIKPQDIIEASQIDLSKDIPISNESIKNDKKLYQEIQKNIKKVLSKGKLPQFFLENYTVTKQIGEGSFGAIYEVYNKETKIKYAMKKIIANNIKSLENVQKEFEIVHENTHPNILDIHGICIRCLDPTTYVLYVLMDKAEKDWEVEINERGKKNKYYKEREIIIMLKQIVNALYFLQKEKNVAHRDIKPENILLFKNNICKIADFGEAKKNKRNRFKTLRGTEFYMSPILYKNLKNKNDYVKHNPYKSDVFSLGYCLICAISLDFDIIEKIRGKDNIQIRQVFNQYFPKFYSDKFIELIFKMIETDEEKRYDFIQLKNILDKKFFC